MRKRHYGELTFLALTIAALVLAVLNYFDLISEWKIAACTASAALLSLSQAFDKAFYYKQITATIEIRLLSFSDNSVEIPKKHNNIDLCALMYVLAIIVLIVGLSLEKELYDSVDLNTNTLLSFALVFLGYWVDSHFSRVLSNISKHLDELEKKNRN